MSWSRRTLVAALVLLSAPALPSVFSSRECDVSFSLPQDWTAHVEAPTHRASDGVKCFVALRPEGWTSRVDASRWNAADPPLWFVIFPPNTPFAEALRISGFQDDELGRGFGVPGGYGTFAPAEEYAIEDWVGLAAYSFFRGFIRSHEFLREKESHVYSGEMAHIVLRSRTGRVIAFEVEGGSPDDPVDCEPVIQRVVKTIVLKSLSRVAPPN